MPARLRIEVFPSDLNRCIAFYTQVLRFTKIRQEADYADLRRDSVSIGAVQKTDPGIKPEYRRWPTGVEIVIEVDDLVEEREMVLEAGWRLDDDIEMQEWGLRDFRILDPDGYYIRITEHGKE